MKHPVSFHDNLDADARKLEKTRDIWIVLHFSYLYFLEERKKLLLRRGYSDCHDKYFQLCWSLVADDYEHIMEGPILVGFQWLNVL